jgi:hypothetical protein
LERDVDRGLRITLVSALVIALSGNGKRYAQPGGGPSQGHKKAAMVRALGSGSASS